VSRRIRFFLKKRGERRTGSRWLGWAGQIVFFMALFLGGAGTLAWMMFVHLIPEWRANRHFVPHTCEVVMTRVRQRDGESGPIYRPDVLIRYQVLGRQYEAWTYSIAEFMDEGYTPAKEEQESALKPFEAGGEFPCWYDPADPSVAVLVRGWSWGAWIMLLLPVSFLVVGGGGLGYAIMNWGASVERRAARSRQAQQVALFGQPGPSPLPYVPSQGDVTNSPGVKLAYRLPMSGSLGWTLAALAAGCLAWNGMVALFFTRAVTSHMTGEPEWFLTLFLVPFILVGAGLVWYTVKQFRIATGVGLTLVEISDHPLYPDREYRIAVTQAGRLKMHSLAVLLVCEERATYQQGTNTRTDVRRVVMQPVLRREAFEIQPGAPYEAESEVRVPAAAMHSFRADHNEIGWSLVVQGDVAGWPSYERNFPVVVYPPEQAGGGRKAYHG
jgi:hypothetical protein